MAKADYRLCDVCGGKAFYDADLSYEDADDDGGVPYRIAGKEQAFSVNVLGEVGDWAVICVECARTHRTRIEELVPVEGEVKNEKYVHSYRLVGDRLQIGVCEPGSLVFTWSMWLIWPESGALTESRPTLVADGDSWRILADQCADVVGMLSVYALDLDGRVLYGEVMRYLRTLGYQDLTGR